MLEDVIDEQILLALPMKTFADWTAPGYRNIAALRIRYLADYGCKPPSGDLRWTTSGEVPQNRRGKFAGLCPELGRQRSLPVRQETVSHPDRQLLAGYGYNRFAG